MDLISIWRLLHTSLWSWAGGSFRPIQDPSLRRVRPATAHASFSLMASWHGQFDVLVLTERAPCEFKYLR